MLVFRYARFSLAIITELSALESFFEIVGAFYQLGVGNDLGDDGFATWERVGIRIRCFVLEYREFSTKLHEKKK